MARPPFDLLKAAFYLLATVILAEVLFSILGALGCFWINMVGRAEIGACLPVATVVREIFAELLTAILALLLAGRVPPPPPPGDE